MPKTKCTTVYQFDELSNDAKEKAREWFRQGALDHDWWDYIYDDFTTIATALGFTIGERSGTHYNKRNKQDVTTTEQKIWFSGFCSQGDGACFEGTWKAEHCKLDKLTDHLGNLAKHPDKELVRIARELAAFATEHPTFYAVLTHRGRYCHKHEIEFDCEEMPVGTDDENCDDLVTKESQEEFEELARDLMEWLYRQLEQEHDYRLSDEAVDEDITGNQYEFFQNGQRATI